MDLINKFFHAYPRSYWKDNRPMRTIKTVLVTLLQQDYDRVSGLVLMTSLLAADIPKIYCGMF